MRAGAEHLQAADLRLEFGDLLGQQRLIIVAGADDDLLGTEAAGGAVQTARFDITDQGGKVKLDAQVAAQEIDQRRNRFAGIQLLVVHAVQRRTVMAELTAVQIAQRSTAQQVDAVTVLHRATFAEGFQQLFFRLGAGEQIRAIAFELQTGELRPVAPDCATGAGQLQHRTGWLAGDQCLAEVAHRSAERRFAALENRDLQTAFCGGIRVGQTQDPGTDDQHVVVLCHGVLS
ncbi:hypothetical protein D3C76_1007300 [compost metagenome]